MPSTRSSSKNQVARAEDSQDDDDGIIESDSSDSSVLVTTKKRPRMRKSRNEDLFEDDDDDDDDDDDEDLLDEDQGRKSSTSGKSVASKTAKKKKTDAAARERRKSDLKSNGIAVDLRVALFVRERRTDKLQWPKNGKNYIGYQPNAVIALIDDQEDDEMKTVLSTSDDYDKLMEAIKGIIPNEYNLVDHKGAIIRVPKAQFMDGDYWREREIEFDEIGNDEQFISALADYGTIKTAPYQQRMHNEAIAKEDPDFDPLARSAGSMEELEYLVLELFVSVEEAAKSQPKKKSLGGTGPTNVTVKFEVAGPVFKYPMATEEGDENDDVAEPAYEYKTSSNKVLGSLEVDLGDSNDVKNRLRLGPIRCRLKKFCESRKLKGYKGKIAPFTRLYYAPNRQSKTVKPVGVSSKQFYDIIMSLKRNKHAQKTGAFMVEMRVALGTVGEGEEPYDGKESEGDDSVIQHTQKECYPYSSPQIKHPTKPGRDCRAATRTATKDGQIIISKLYLNPQSPYYHGLTKEHCDILKSRWNDKTFRQSFTCQGDNWPTDLEVYFQGSDLIKQQVNQLVPKKGAFPPDTAGQPPSHPPPGPVVQESSRDKAFAAIAAMADRVGKREEVELR
jgi:hypothetical protein